MDLLQQFFCQADIDAILKIRTSTRQQEVYISWPLDRSGFFTVKTAYHLAMAVHTEQFSPGASSSSPTGDRAIWNLVWKASVPPKMRMFAWQVASGSLVTNLKKHRHHLGTHGNCPLCGRERESSFHALLVCPNASAFWDTMQKQWPLPNRIDITCTCDEWFLHFLAATNQGYDHHGAMAHMASP